MFLKQGNYQWTYVRKETLHVRICKKKGKIHFADFLYLAWAVCRLLSKVENESKTYIMYIFDVAIDIFITHVCILMEELCFQLSLALRETLEKNPNIINNQNLFNRFQPWS